MQQKLFAINKISVIIMDMNSLILYSILSLLLTLYFVGNYEIIQSVEGQINMDSFSARGSIVIPLTHSPLLNDQTLNNTQLLSNMLTESNNSMQSNPSKTLPSFRGEWAFQVNKGEVEFFRVILALVQNERIVNAFGIFNLTATKYIQLNDKGTEIITGTVDLTSMGIKNETLRDLPATITITGLTQLRISLDKAMTKQYFTDPIIGSTRFLADGSGNIIIQPRPAAPPGQHSPTAPLPQFNSFSDSKIF